MPKPFLQLTREQFIELLWTFPFKRRIESVHMHHTWRPNRAQYKGVSTIESMWSYHTQTKKWSDIAQHISIAPDGSIWTGRSWNQSPASAEGFNGNASAGPFMFETIGDFDKGKDPFDGEQRKTVMAVIANVQKRFSLEPGTLRFHNSMSEKSCPGSALDYAAIVAEVAEMHAQIKGPPAARGASRAPGAPFEDRARFVWQAVDLLKTPQADRGHDEGEGCEHDHREVAEFERTTIAPPQSSPGARGGQLPPDLLQRLRPHVINLSQGRFSTDGEFQTSQADVDAMFEEHLPKWARSREGKLPIVFYAHGGLTSEQGGLLIADSQVGWWKENGAYPIHFVWETGLLEILGQLLNPNRQRAIDFAAPTDFAIETLARALGGVKVWSGMKVSAERAVEPEGGALYAARKLKAFCERPEFKDRVELHAVGHSAGSIFHAHFLPAALAAGVPRFDSLHFLAPAIRVDTFEELLLDRIGTGKGVEHFSVFTMARDFELDDNCAVVYRKSLLYLIHYALEAERKTPILGLEVSIRANARLKRLFDLDGNGGAAGDVAWAVTRETTGLSATTSCTHGGFNEDRPTMQSVAHRILGHASTPFPVPAKRGLGVVESLQAREPSLAGLLRPALAPPAPFAYPVPATPMAGPAAPAIAGGRRRALCIGIDRYPSSPLAGCVNDAREWRQTFLQLGFEDPQMLVDGEATRSAILGTLTELLRSSRPGDVVAFQFAGHGTYLPDLDGDEKGGDTPDSDEALCPVDFDSGQFVLDDDLAAVFDRIPAGVSVTMFADCCHSGSTTRLAIGPPPAYPGGRDVRRRFIPPTAEMARAHAAFRGSAGANRGSPGATRAPGGRGAYDKALEVLFAACRSSEVAIESDGHGHFTTRATRLLASGIQGLTNKDFQQRVVDAFGANSGQNPELHCADAIRSRGLLAPIGGAADHRIAAPARAQGEAWRGDLAQVLETAARALRG